MSAARVFEDFEPGQKFASAGLTITESHIVSWSSLTGDWTWLHVDAERAAASVFRERVAHGPLTFAVALGLMTQTEMLGDGVVAWLGADELRLPAPVRINDTVTVHCRVERTEATRADRGLVEIAYEVHNQRREPVMTFRSSFLMQRARAGAPDEVNTEARRKRGPES